MAIFPTNEYMKSFKKEEDLAKKKNAKNKEKKKKKEISEKRKKDRASGKTSFKSKENVKVFIPKFKRKQGKFNYSDYLKSKHWKKVRSDYQKSCYWKEGCAVCGSKPENVHHRNYDCIGRENREDLMPLCRKCHERMHGLDIGKKYTSKKMLRKQEALFLPKKWSIIMRDIRKKYKVDKKK